MIWRPAILAILYVATFAPGAAAQKRATPLFDDFQRFCVVTGAVPDAVNRAAKGAGLRLVRAFADGKPITRMSIYDRVGDSTNWSLTTGTEAHPAVTKPEASSPARAQQAGGGGARSALSSERRVRLAAKPTERQAAAKAGPEGAIILSHDCEVRVHDTDEASLAKLRQWAGVTPQSELHDFGAVILYSWEQRDGKHWPLPKDRKALAEAEQGGRIWNLLLVRSTRYLSAQLANRLAGR